MYGQGKGNPCGADLLKSWARAVKALRAKMAAASVCICINGGDGDAPPGQGLAPNGVAYMQLFDCLWHFQVHGHVCIKRLFAQDFSLRQPGSWPPLLWHPCAWGMQQASTCIYFAITLLGREAFNAGNVFRQLSEYNSV